MPWALAIFQNLNNNGYDVFFDYNGIASGDFERAILGNIKARAHFLVLLTPSALERCGDPADWLRREIETALETKRNIVPLMLEGFDFSTPAIANQLTGALANLKRYNALGVPAEYFMEAMERLRQKYLNVALDAVTHPASQAVRKAAEGRKKAADAAPAVRGEELTAQQWFERGFEAKDLDEKIRFYTQAIRFKPNYADAFINRGAARQESGDLTGAIEDYNDAIRLNPDDQVAFYNRGNVRREKGDLTGVIEDYNEAIRLKPDYANAFNNRGIARKEKGDLTGAIGDYNEAIRLNPDDQVVFYNRGNVRREKGDLTGAIEDYREAIRLKPDFAGAFYNRGIARGLKGDAAGAIEDYSEAIRLNPDNTNALYNRAEVLENKGDYESAIADFQKYLDFGGGVRDGDQAKVEQRIRDLRKKLEEAKEKRNPPN